MKGQRIIRRYSSSFKHKIVKEIENGKLSISEARSLYDIKGEQTIQRWIKRLGKNHLLNKVVRIEMKDEPKKVKELEKEKKALESALAQAHLKILTLESSMKVLEEKSGVSLKKKTDNKSSKKS
jgi:transposase-like protein